MNEGFGEAFLNISKFIIDQGYVSNAREVDNIVEALSEQTLANMFDSNYYATSFKIALKSVNPRMHENAASGEKRQAAAIAMKLAEYSRNNATYLKPGSKAPEKDAEGAAGEYNPRGSEKKPKGGSGAVNAALKGKVTQTEEHDNTKPDPEETAKKKARLEKKRGMKLDDHPEYKTEAADPADESRMKVFQKLQKAVDQKKKVKKEEVEQVEEEGKKDACYHKVKASAKVWPSAYASGRLVQCRKKGADNYGNSKKEGFDIDHLLDDPTFDLISEEELLHFAFDIFEEMEQEGILTEAVEYFDDFLIEVSDSYYDSATKQSKANARGGRKERVMGALKKAGSAIKSAGSAAAGRAKEMAKKAAPVVKKGAETAGRAVKAAAKGGASLAKKAAVKTAGAAGEVAGAAVGGFQKGKANASAGSSSSKPSSSSSSSSSGGDKVDDAIRSVQKSGGSSSGGSSSGGSSDSGTATRKRGLLRRVGSAIKSGLKKAVGKTARGVSSVSGSVAKRMGEESEFDIVLDYLLENEVCTLDNAEEYMINLSEDEVKEILGKVE
tara:strand:- start:1662 stop:3320 length:1659 start_codon:yes stop_codon:yes gene_type:complete